MLSSKITILLLVIPIGLVAQPQLTQEVEAMVAPIVEALNKFDQVKTVAIADFTDKEHKNIPVGRFLAEEFMTSFVQYSGKNFVMTNRAHLKVLMNELKLDQKGVLSPDNIPRLGQLKSIDVIISATIVPFSNNLRLNVQAVQLQTGAVMAGQRGIITLTPVLGTMLNTAKSSLSKDQKPSPPEIYNAAFQHQNISISLKSCNRIDNTVRCNLETMSSGRATHLSIYTQYSQAIANGQEITVSRATLGSDSGKGRVTSTLYPDEAEELTIEFPAPPSNGLLGLSLSFYSQEDGNFTAKFESIPIN